MTANQHHELLPNVAIGLGVAGLLPILPIIGSVAAIVCGGVALRSEGADRDRSRLGIALGAVGLLAPLAFLFVYCVVLGYPFPIHRYRPG